MIQERRVVCTESVHPKKHHRRWLERLATLIPIVILIASDHAAVIRWLELPAEMQSAYYGGVVGCFFLTILLSYLLSFCPRCNAILFLKRRHHFYCRNCCVDWWVQS